MKPILEAFDHAGIPYVSGRRQSFLLSREGRDITALLHVIDNPRDTVALATAYSARRWLASATNRSCASA